MLKRLKTPLILLVCMVSTLLAKDYRHSLKLRCFQCWSPNHCQHGLCYGDVCVKTTANGLANNGYVVKGCENVTRSVTTDIYEPHMKHKSYCKTELVLGIDTTICYCRDGDWCNSSPFLSIFSSICIFFIGIL